MKKGLILIFSIGLFSSCADSNNKAAGKPITKEERRDTIQTNLWGPIDIKSWSKTPSMNGRVATENDVKSGLAVYYVKDGGYGHKAYEIQLPKLAYLTDSGSKKDELVVVIQIEFTSEDTLGGYRNLNGGNGVCLFNELKFLDEKQVRTIAGN